MSLCIRSNAASQLPSFSELAVHWSEQMIRVQSLPHELLVCIAWLWPMLLELDVGLQNKDLDFLELSPHGNRLADAMNGNGFRAHNGGGLFHTDLPICRSPGWLWLQSKAALKDHMRWLLRLRPGGVLWMSLQPALCSDGD